MSRNIWSWVVLPLATIFAMVLTLLGSISPATAAPQPDCIQLAVDPVYPDIPPPWQCDRSGSDQDAYYVAYHVRPGENGSGVEWRSGDQVLVQDREVKTGGLATMVISTRVYDNPTMAWVAGPAWTLNYGLGQTAPEAPNTFRYVIGACNDDTKKVSVTAYFVNTDDESDRIVKRAYFVLRYAFNDDLVFGLPQFAENVADGQSGLVGTYDLYPADYAVFLSYTENGTKIPMSQPLRIPACGGMAPIGSGGPGLSKPAVRFTQMRYHRMKVAMVNRQVDRTTKFRVVINKPGPGGRVVKSYTVGPDRRMRRTFRRPVGTTFVVKATVSTKVAGSTYKMKWRVLGRRTMLR